jgi:thiol:disulfide interchange protein
VSWITTLVLLAAAVWVFYRVLVFASTNDLVGIAAECIRYEVRHRKLDVRRLEMIAFIVLLIFWTAATVTERTLHGLTHVSLIGAVLMLAHAIRPEPGYTEEPKTSSQKAGA